MHAADIEQLLPSVIRRAALPGTPLGALLAVMEALHAPAEDALAELPHTLDVQRSPDRFVGFLARWVDLAGVAGEADDTDAAATADTGSTADDGGRGNGRYAPGTGQLRQLVAAAANLARWRGTARGLVEFLEIATGIAGFAIDEEVPGPDGQPRPYHLSVRVPPAASTYDDLIATIVEAEKPVYVTAELAFAEPEPVAEAVAEAQPEPEATP